jgi:rhodanese-related sulfurtransferase
MIQQYSKPVKGVTVQQAYEMLENDTNVVFLDVRTPGEYRSKTGHLWFYEREQKKDALLIPIQELQNRVKELEPYKGKTLIAYCRTGNRSGAAAEYLEKMGYSVFNLVGGIVRWHAEGFPVIHGDPK